MLQLLLLHFSLNARHLRRLPNVLSVFTFSEKATRALAASASAWAIAAALLVEDPCVRLDDRKTWDLVFKE